MVQNISQLQIEGQVDRDVEPLHRVTPASQSSHPPSSSLLMDVIHTIAINRGSSGQECHNPSNSHPSDSTDGRQSVCNQSGSVENPRTPVSKKDKIYSHKPYIKLILTDVSNGSLTDKRNATPSVSVMEMIPFQGDRWIIPKVRVPPGHTARRPGQINAMELSNGESMLPFHALNPFALLNADGGQGFGSRRHDVHLTIPHDVGQHFNIPNPAAVPASWRNGAMSVLEETPPERLRHTEMLPSPPPCDETLSAFELNKNPHPDRALYRALYRWYKQYEKHLRNYILCPGGCGRRKRAMELYEWCPVFPQGMITAEILREWAIRCEVWYVREFGHVMGHRAPRC